MSWTSLARIWASRRILLGFLLGAGILQQFDGHVPPEQLVGRPVDGAHAALAELLVQGESLVERRADADHPISPSRAEKAARAEISVKNYGALH